MKSILKRFFTKSNIIILGFILLGLLIGVLSTNNTERKSINLILIEKSYIRIFLNTFSLNFWYFFIIWTFGLIRMGFILTYFSGFIRSFMLGVTLGICAKSSAIFGVFQYSSFIIIEILFNIPLLIYTMNKSVAFSLRPKNSSEENAEIYFKNLLIIVIAIILFSIIATFRKSIIEVT